MIRVRLVERVDGEWCAYIEGEEDGAEAGPTGDEALGRLIRGRAGRFGIGEIRTTNLDPGLAGEGAARSRRVDRVIGPDSRAPELHDHGAGDPENLSPPGDAPRQAPD